MTGAEFATFIGARTGVAEPAGISGLLWMAWPGAISTLLWIASGRNPKLADLVRGIFYREHADPFLHRQWAGSELCSDCQGECSRLGRAEFYAQQAPIGIETPQGDQ